MDLEAIVEPPVGPVEAEAGYTLTTAFTGAPVEDETSHEVFGEAALPAALTPRALVVYDFHQLNAVYGEFGVAREVVFADQPVEFEVVAGVDNGFLEVGDGFVFSHVGLDASTVFSNPTADVELIGRFQYSIDDVYQEVSGDFPVVVGARLHW